MTTPALPLAIDPATLEHWIGADNVLIVDLAGEATYDAGHIRGAIRLDYADIVTANPPVLGLLPDAEHIQAVCAHLGIHPETRVIATDDEVGGKSARLIWTLAAWGHRHLSWLDGGNLAWSREGHRLVTERPSIPAGDFVPALDESVIADRDWILNNLNRPDVVLLDTRSTGEYDGGIRRSLRSGHIPGAVNYEWTRAMRGPTDPRLRPREALLAELAALGVTPDKEVVTYCQSHHRSAHTWLVLKSLGFPRVRGYHGAWSDWGNAPDTPVEA